MTTQPPAPVPAGIYSDEISGEVSIAEDVDTIFESDFSTGACGFVGLYGGGGWTNPPYGQNQQEGAISLVCDPALFGPYSLEFNTEDVADTGDPQGSAMAIKRMFRPQPDSSGRLMIGCDWWFTFRALHPAANTPRAIDFGLDTADAAGNRTFYKFRLYLNDSSHKWQMQSGPGSAIVITDIPGSDGLVNGINENKSGWNHVQCYYDLAAGVYAGLIVNGVPFGTAVGGAPLPSAAGANTPINEGVLTSFANGMNPLVELRNRTDTNATKAWCYIGSAKVTRA